MSTPNDAAAAATHIESSLWKGHTSQWVHFWFYALCLILAIGIGVSVIYAGPLALAGLVLPLIAAILRWLVTKSTSYELTTQRLRRAKGILHREYDDLELFRVKDYVIEQPLVLRLLGLGNLTLFTSDATTPTVALYAIRDAMAVRELLRTAVQSERDRKRVREMDVDGGASAIVG